MSTAAADRWQVYDRPELRSSVSLPAAGGHAEVLIGADGLHCQACVSRLRALLADQVEALSIDLASRTLQFRHDPARRPLSGLLQQLQEAGFEPRVLAQDAELADVRRQQRRALARIGVAVLGAMQVMMLAWPGYGNAAAIAPDMAALLRWTQLAIATPVVFYAGAPFLAGGWRALRAGAASMDLPVALSLLIAWGVSALRVVAGSGDLYFDAATMFVMLLGAGRYLEGRTRALAGDRLRRLAGQRRLTARRETADGVETVPLSAVRPGEILRVAAGEAVPADGCLLDATAALDESLLNGESRAVSRSTGDAVLAGSLNAGAAPLRLTVTAVDAATRLAAILRLQLQAGQQRPPLQRIADRIAGHFVLAVLLLAAAAAVWWWPAGGDRALTVALAVLVASCPCALSLAVPAVIAAASGRLAQRGVLLARPAVLERLPKIDTVLFDKTGTLTRDALQLCRTIAVGTLSVERSTAIAAALEHGLAHPVARAFAGEAREGLSAEDLQLQPGGGLRGRVDGRSYSIGPAERSGLVLPPGMPDAADLTWLLLRDEHEALAWFALAPQLRPEAASVIRALRRQGLQIELLSGDGDGPVRTLARQTGIRHWRARQSPEQKLARLQQLQRAGRRVLVVGDGINDAPFLAAADVGVAMPGGAALAQARADAVLVGDSLDGLLALRRFAQTAGHRLRQNLAWAALYNLAVLPLAASGLLLPWIAALGMSLSSLLVVANALRLDEGNR